MTRTNTDIVREYVEAINRNDFDRLFDFCSGDCVYHVPPYVGLGIRARNDAGGRVAVAGLVAHAPAEGILEVDDILLRVQDGSRTWETTEDLKMGFWGWGIPETPLTITVERHGARLELQLLRGHVPSFDHRLADYYEMWRDDKLENWPDLKSEITQVFEKDDLVALCMLHRGTNRQFQRAAIWSECSIFRLQDGKITEMWGAEDGLAQVMQLGYELREPQKTLVV